jgi:protein ImuB
MKKYAVLLAPEFQLQAVLRHSPGLSDQPVALLTMQGTKPRVSELNAPARNFQVERGMTPTQAMARCGHLHLIHANAGYEQSAGDILLQTAESLSPYLEVTAPGVVTLELPDERAFTAEELLQKCISPLRSTGLEVQMGVAATPGLALLAARFAAPVRMVESAAIFLGPLPISALQPAEELLAVLESWGIRSIGQLIALPMTQVCERLGSEALELWERANGGRMRPLQLVKPQEFFGEQTDLEYPLETLEPLLFLLRRFLEQLAARLAAVYLVAGKLRLVLRFERGPAYQRVFTIPQPTREVDMLFRMLHTHLENFTSESPIIGLELAAKPVRPNTEQFGLLEKGLRDPHRFAETVARLQALLGADRVGSPQPDLSHHPDSFRMRSFESDAAVPDAEAEPLIGIPWLRFRPPIQARVILNDIRPAFLYSSRWTGPIREARGPWQLEGHWWESRRWSRQEWDIATDESFYRLVHAGEGWFLDGIYV